MENCVYDVHARHNIHGGRCGSKQSHFVSLGLDLLPKVRDNLRAGIGILAFLDVLHHVVQVGLGFVEAAGLGIRTIDGATHQKVAVVVVVGPYNPGLKGGRRLPKTRLHYRS